VGNSLGELLKGLNNTVLKYVYAWLLPSIFTVVCFAVLVAPLVGLRWQSSGEISLIEALLGTAIFAVVVLALSTTFGLLSVPIYRIVEGYTLPDVIANPLRRRQLRRWRRLKRVANARTRGVETSRRRLAGERLEMYPTAAADIMPTTLGNALRALESYADHHYNFDSQRLWYELVSMGPATIRQDIDDARAPIDIFISFMAHLLLLALVCVALVPFFPSEVVQLLGIAVASIGLSAGAYAAAVRNVREYGDTVQALVNTARLRLVEAMGFTLPATADDEIAMWSDLSRFVDPLVRDPHRALASLDVYRSSTED
jgi:hypothetical protein